MKITTLRRFEFSASRQLSNGRLHGNNFYGWAGVRGDIDPHTGMLINIVTLKSIVNQILDRYDHRNLNNSLGLIDANTVAVSQILWEDLQLHLPSEVELESLELAEMDEHAALVEHDKSYWIVHGGFSAAHRTHAPKLSPEENRRRYGICDNPTGHGHNYQVEIALPPGADINSQLWKTLDHRNLSLDLPEFANINVVTETIAHYIAHLEPLSYRVRVWETPDFYAEYLPGDDLYRLGRRYRFHAAHRLNSPYISPEENRLIYGKCNRPDPHGHTYVALVNVEGRLDPMTETAYDLACLDQVAQEIFSPLDYTYLDRDIAYFADHPTTGENIVAFLYDQFQPKLGSSLASVQLWETANNQFVASRDA